MAGSSSTPKAATNSKPDPVQGRACRVISSYRRHVRRAPHLCDRHSAPHLLRVGDDLTSASCSLWAQPTRQGGRAAWRDALSSAISDSTHGSGLARLGRGVRRGGRVGRLHLYPASFGRPRLVTRCDRRPRCPVPQHSDVLARRRAPISIEGVRAGRLLRPRTLTSGTRHDTSGRVRGSCRLPVIQGVRQGGGAADTGVVPAATTGH